MRTTAFKTSKCKEYGPFISVFFRKGKATQR
jgi:hypothetical protein